MTSHDPLTESQKALLHELEHAPFEMSIREQMATPRGNDLQYLMAIGLVKVEPTHIAQDQGNNRFRYSWSGKRP